MTPTRLVAPGQTPPGAHQRRTAPLSDTERLCVDGVCFDNISSGTALSIIRHYLTESEFRLPRTIFFVNVHSIHVARESHALRKALREADLVLPDGSGLAFAGKISGKPVSENLNGTDFVPRILDELVAAGGSVYLLGARPPVLEKCISTIAARYPGLVIAGSRHGHFPAETAAEVARAINDAAPDVVLVGMGTPAQETWIANHRSDLHAKICIGVGGLFDFLSGEKPRAPEWIRNLGLEWGYRFTHEPASKWQRVFLEIPMFVARTLARQISVTAHPVRSHRVAQPLTETEK